MRDPKTAIRDEFTAHYHADEVPPATELERSLDARARASAVRLRRAVGEEGIPALIQLLGEIRIKLDHPLHSDIAASSLIHWPDDPSMWAIFGALVELLVAELGSPVNKGTA